MTEAACSGLLTELHCQMDFTQENIMLSKPISTDSRYDYIADINGKLYKIQCKTASPNQEGTCIEIDCFTTNIRQKTIKPYTANEVDYFYTWYRNKSYLIPFEVGGKTAKCLRFSVKLGGNQPNIIWAKDYELRKVLIGIGYSLPKKNLMDYPEKAEFLKKT